MSHTVRVEIDRLEATLPRIIGLVERRGFHIDELVLSDLGENRGLIFKLRPRDPSRSFENLGFQIDKLYGVKRILDDQTT